MSSNTFKLKNIDKVNFYASDNGPNIYLEGVSTGTSGVCVSQSLLVNGDFVNFGNTLGSGGYGINNNSGSIRFKHSGGNWANMISALVDDTTPQLGGDLDVNDYDIVSASNGDIEFTPNGTGKVIFKGVTGNGGNGAGRFVLNCEQNSHGITIQGPPHSAAADYTLTFPNDDGNANQVLKTDGSGVLSWTDQSSGGAVAGSDADIQFNDGGSFGGVSALQFHKSTTTTGVSTLSVDGNVFSSMGVSDSQADTPAGTHQITAKEFVNGFVFPPYYSTDESQLFSVKVPSFTDIQTAFPSTVLKEGQTFDTVIYGTSIGSSPAIGTSFPSDITIVENTGVIFDRRLASDKSISTGLSFHFADATLDYYQGVVIKSRMGSTGVSMYPYATSFYTC